MRAEAVEHVCVAEDEGVKRDWKRVFGPTFITLHCLHYAAYLPSVTHLMSREFWCWHSSYAFWHMGKFKKTQNSQSKLKFPKLIAKFHRRKLFRILWARTQTHTRGRLNFWTIAITLEAYIGSDLCNFKMKTGFHYKLIPFKDLSALPSLPSQWMIYP